MFLVKHLLRLLSYLMTYQFINDDLFWWIVNTQLDDDFVEEVICDYEFIDHERVHFPYLNHTILIWNLHTECCQMYKEWYADYQLGDAPAPDHLLDLYEVSLSEATQEVSRIYD